MKALLKVRSELRAVSLKPFLHSCLIFSCSFYPFYIYKAVTDVFNSIESKTVCPVNHYSISCAGITCNQIAWFWTTASGKLVKNIACAVNCNFSGVKFIQFSVFGFFRVFASLTAFFLFLNSSGMFILRRKISCSLCFFCFINKGGIIGHKPAVNSLTGF